MGSTSSVLVVENDEGRRQVLERLLAAAGYRVVAVEGDLEELSLAAELQPDSILLAASAGGLAEISRRSRQLHSLQLASAALTSGQDLDYVLRTVAAEMASLLEMKACAILQWDPAEASLSLLAQSGPEAWWQAKWPAQAGDLSRLPATQQVLVEGRVRQLLPQEPGVDPDELAAMQRHGITTVLQLPMVFQEQVVGLVEVLDDGQGRSLAEEEVVLARLLANQIASAIEDARLTEVTRRYMVEATTLNSIGQVITSSLDLHQTLSIIADHAHWLLDVEAASVILRDEEGDALWFGAASGESADFVRGQRLANGQGIVNWVVQHGEPQMVPDASKDPRWFGDWDKETGFVTRSMPVCAPANQGPDHRRHRSDQQGQRRL